MSRSDTQLSLRSEASESSARSKTWGEGPSRSIADDPRFFEFCADRRFTIRRRLGAGGMGVVYEALDHERGEVVALKTLLGVSPEALYRFKREFRALVDVTHPNLILLHDLFSEGEQMFFTMEFVDGVDFVEWMREPVAEEETATSRAILHDRLRAGLRQIAGAVGEIHAAGMLHRDLKPSNVLVTDAGRLVVLDFGLVSESVMETLRSDSGGDMVGTPGYISPEQAGGGKASPASDWYAVGVMAFVGLTGRLPFTGKGLRMLLAKQELDPPAPSSLVEHPIPEELESLVLDLLSRDPARRPGADEILERLGEDDSSASSGPRRELVVHDASIFVGRHGHLRALHEAFAATHHARAVAVHVYGRSGMGKTALIRRFLGELREQHPGTIILGGRCYERESVSFKALDSLVDALCHYLIRLPEARAAELMPRDISTLARVFPILQRVSAVANAPRRPAEIPDPRELRRRAFAALRELLARMADRKPMVLYIDDLQWGDRDSAALLADLLRPPDAPALLLIACFRSEYSSSAPVLRALREQATSDVDIRGVEVGPLSVVEACDLATELLRRHHPANTQAGRAQLRARARQIARESQGSPLFVNELVRHVEVEADGERPEGHHGEILLDQVLAARLSRVPLDARRLLEIIAVAGGPLDERLATSAAGLSGDTRSALAALRADHWVLTHTADDAHTVESYHDRIREFVLSRLDSDGLRARHRDLAFAMERAGGSDDDTLAVHFREAGEWERAGDYARTAADHAAAALAFDRAARLYRLALEFMPHSDPGLAALQCRLADALANGGRGGRAARIYLEAADRSSPARALDLRRRAAEQLLQAGHYAEGVATMRAVVTAVGSKFPDGPRKTLTLLGFERVRLRLRGLGRRIRDARRVDPDELIKLDVFRSVASGLSAHDPATAALFHARHLALALKVGHAAHAACALAAEVAITSLSGERTREKTERIVNAAQALTQRVKSPYPRGLLTMTRGLAAFNMGRWRDAVSLIERAEELLRSECVGAGYEITIGQTFRLIALTHLGDLRALGEGLERYLNAANERDNLWADTTLRAGPQNMCWLAADDTRRARGELIRVGKRWPEGGFSLQRILTVIAKVHIELYSGEGGEAWGRVTGRWAEMTQEFFHEWQWLRITMVHLRACAALVRVVEEGSARERAGLLRGADADARVLLRERALWARPLAETLQAAVDELEGLRDAAIGRLQSAEQGFRTVDMHLHAAVARYRRGQLLGAQGQETRESALAYLEDQGVAAPVRMARLIAPGFSRLEE